MNSTIAGNSAQYRGGGIMISSGSLELRNTIVALNTAGAGGGPDLYGSLLSHGFNLVGNASSATIMPAQFSDRIGTAASPIDPLLGPLQNNGGTLTRALLVGSPAIDQGEASGATTDQRGHPRLYDEPTVANAPGSDGSDIGAFEAGSVPTALVNISTRLRVETGDNVLIGGFISAACNRRK
ncbi:MAG: hypothetical protein M3Q86_11245 [Verrucomicrobiota bacterium]|nr:hypothetical protein [Verrucomicrobiota bacterium]